MDFKAMQDEVAELLNFNSAQTDQDFTTAQIKKAINRGYAREYRKARQEGVREWFSGYREAVYLLCFRQPEWRPNLQNNRCN